MALRDVADRIEIIFHADRECMGAGIQNTRAQQKSEIEKLKLRLAETESSNWEGFDPDSETYPPELDIAMQAWRAVTNGRDINVNPKNQIETWIDEHYPDRKKLSKEAKERIAVICNWEKSGGRRRRD